MKSQWRLLIFVGSTVFAMRVLGFQVANRRCLSTPARSLGRHDLIWSSSNIFMLRNRKAKRPNMALFMSTETTRTLAPGSHVSEMEVKKSRFLGYAKHAENWDEASAYIERVKAEHPKARHWCYGFQCGVNPVSERCSDDGEPAGTAGLPILGAIKGEGLSDVVCVVVRYFGGIKLGAGGLIRAYGAAARQVLREAPVDVLIPKATFRVSVMSGNVGSVYDSVAKAGGSTSGEEYGVDGSLTVTITCDLEVAQQLKDGLTDSTRGAARFPDDEEDE